MTKANQLKVYEGGCHCGAVRFPVRVQQERAIACNCSICRQKGLVHLIVPPEQFTLLQGEEILTTYTFNTHTARHSFCSICGIHPFYRPRSHPQAIDVNLRCLDEDLASQFESQPFDGAHWEKNIDQLQNSGRSLPPSLE